MTDATRAQAGRALHDARVAALPAGEYAGQEGFMTASEILALARRAGIGPGVTVLDLCCGVGGPGRLITGELGGDYLGVDASAEAIDIATARSRGLPCRFQVQRVPPVPAGRYDVVLLLETFLAFRDKPALVRSVGATLRPGGRFAGTLEAGAPLSETERAVMPDSGTVWPLPLPDLVAVLAGAGLRLEWYADHTASHAGVVDGLVAAFTDRRRDIAASIGVRRLDTLLAGHRLWSRWLHEGRVRKIAFVARKPAAADQPGSPNTST